MVDLADAALYAVKHGGRNGWLGVVQASAESAAALQEAAAQPLARWAASGTLQVAVSAGVAGWLASAAPQAGTVPLETPASTG